MEHEEISLQAVKDQHIGSIAKLRSFNKIGWRKEENWGWNPNLIKLEELIKSNDIIKLLTCLFALFKT
jgi:hypothetical protein